MILNNVTRKRFMTMIYMELIQLKYAYTPMVRARLKHIAKLEGIHFEETDIDSMMTIIKECYDSTHNDSHELILQRFLKGISDLRDIPLDEEG